MTCRWYSWLSNEYVRPIQFREKIQVDLASSPLYEISGATLIANLIGYATIIMQIGGRLAAADRAELKFRPRLGEEKTRERRAVVCILMLLHAAPSI